jgi:hypothetical protein
MAASLTLSSESEAESGTGGGTVTIEDVLSSKSRPPHMEARALRIVSLSSRDVSIGGGGGGARDHAFLNLEIRTISDPILSCSLGLIKDDSEELHAAAD